MIILSAQLVTPKAPIDNCPYCNSNDGYYTKQYARGTIKYNYNFDGSESENGDMHDNLSYSGGKYAYCINCKKRLFNMSQL